MKLVLLLAVGAAGHGMLTFPASRVGGNLHDAASYGDMDMQTFNNASWFSQTSIPGSATNCGQKYTTGIKCGTRDSTQPWRAPGTAKVFSPCGGFCLVGDSDTPNGCDPNDLSKYSTKHDGRNLPKNDRAQWQAGGTARVGFTALFNHGGGYAYRLCSAGDEQTEECFQKTHLNFASENSTVVPSRRSKGKGGEYAAVTMTTGTHPEGSQWRTIRMLPAPNARCS